MLNLESRNFEHIDIKEIVTAARGQNELPSVMSRMIQWGRIVGSGVQGNGLLESFMARTLLSVRIVIFEQTCD